MQTTSLATLEQAELLGLALQASRNNQHGTALVYLKEAASRTDATATAHYLLGAEYAQIQMMDRAIVEMEAAIAIDPTLSTARIQLALLLLAKGAIEPALSVLHLLTALDINDALQHFGMGLIHLIRDEFDHAVSSLNKGLTLNSSNPALNRNMQRLIDQICNLPADILKKSQDGDGIPEDPSARHIFLSAYTGSRNQ